MARPAHDCTLGNSRPSCGERYTGGNRTRVPRGLSYVETPNRFVSESAARKPRLCRDQKRNRSHRETMTHTLLRRIVSEFLGTGFLVAAVVGSGIMGERLAAGDVAIALLANTIATGAALF